MTVQQVETATVVGTITLTGNASVTVTAYGMTGSPLTLSVAVTNADTASTVAGLIRTALAFNANVAAMFLVSGATDKVILTRHIAAANDSTLNIATTNGTCTGLTPAPTSTNTTAGTGMTNGYCTIAQVKSVDVLNFSDTAHDANLETIIEAVSREFDKMTGRRFYSATETRYYTAKKDTVLMVDDIATDSGLTIYTDDGGDGTFENTWDTTDYNLSPYNATLNGGVYELIQTAPAGLYRFPIGISKGVKVTGTFGWTAVPSPITYACILQNTREYQRLKTALGIAGATATGTLTFLAQGIDPDVEMMLKNYVKVQW